MIAYTRQGAKTSEIGRGGICTPMDCIRVHPKGMKGELRAKREREALRSKGAGEPTLDTGMGLQVEELEGRLEVMKGSQEERQTLEIGEAAPQSTSKQPGETEMEGFWGRREPMAPSRKFRVPLQHRVGAACKGEGFG